MLLAATLPSLIIFTAVIAVAAVPFIIFSLPPAVLRLPLMPPYTPLSPTIIAAATAVVVNTIRRYYSNTIVTDVIANAIAAVISTAVAAAVSIKF